MNFFLKIKLNLYYDKADEFEAITDGVFEDLIERDNVVESCSFTDIKVVFEFVCYVKYNANSTLNLSNETTK